MNRFTSPTGAVSQRTQDILVNKVVAKHRRRAAGSWSSLKEALADVRKASKAGLVNYITGGTPGFRFVAEKMTVRELRAEATRRLRLLDTLPGFWGK
jgi:hypothetical protein